MPFERSKCHQAKQETNESIEQYITRLRQLCLYCEYNDNDEEILDHVIATCKSSKLQKCPLTEADLTLEKLITISQT